jgi:hypothetical protein
MTKQPKPKEPSDADLKQNPMIGGSKGVTRSRTTPDELEQSQGANTIEGDEANDTNRSGGIDKDAARNRRRSPHI